MFSAHARTSDVSQASGGFPPPPLLLPPGGFVGLIAARTRSRPAVTELVSTLTPSSNPDTANTNFNVVLERANTRLLRTGDEVYRVCTKEHALTAEVAVGIPEGQVDELL